MTSKHALNRIRKILPPPHSPTFPQNGTSHVFGAPSALPSDYRRFIECYGIGSICCSNGRLRLADLSTETSSGWSIGECLKGLMEEGLLPREAIFPEPNGLLAWGDDEEDVDFFWRTAPDNRRWQVTYYNRVRFTATDLSFTEFLLRLLTNKLDTGLSLGDGKNLAFLPSPR